MVSRVAVCGRAELGGWSSGRGQFVGFGAIVRFVGAIHFSTFPIKLGKSK